MGGEYLIGARTKCNFLWQGTKGDSLTKTSLPTELQCWVPQFTKRLLGVDSTGRLHSMRRKGDKWVQTDFLEGFVSSSPVVACTIVEKADLLIVFTGSAVAGISIKSDGRFGARFSPELVQTYDGPIVVANRLGLCLATNSAGQVLLSAPLKAIELGAFKADCTAPIALAPNSTTIALIGADLKLFAAIAAGNKIVKTNSDNSPVLHSDPFAMCWSKFGELLVVTFGDKTWRVFHHLSSE